MSGDRWTRFIAEFQKLIEEELSEIQLSLFKSLGFEEILKGIDLESIQMGFRATTIDPYKVLGLERTASDEEVKRRFREFAQILHPDTAKIKGTETLFSLIVEAYNQIGKERGWK